MVAQPTKDWCIKKDIKWTFLEIHRRWNEAAGISIRDLKLTRILQLVRHAYAYTLPLIRTRSQKLVYTSSWKKSSPMLKQAFSRSFRSLPSFLSTRRGFSHSMRIDRTAVFAGLRANEILKNPNEFLARGIDREYTVEQWRDGEK